jgi:hypothetical protein
MKATPEVRVTLSDALLSHLRCRASELKLPIEWLIAGLVCDTLDELAEASHSRTAPGS